MKKTLLICSGLIVFIPLASIAVDVAHKIGINIVSPLIVENQNLSFGTWIPRSGGGTIAYVEQNTVKGQCCGNIASPLQEGHPGTIKITGHGYVSIQSTPPSRLVNVKDTTKTLIAGDRPYTMRIIKSDGSGISDMNKVEINGELELKTVGSVIIPIASEATIGEYKADWPITIDYIGYDGPE